VLARHRALGKRVVFVDKGDIVVAEGAFEKRLPLSRVPLTMGGRIGFQVDNTLASVGAAWAAQVPWDVLRTGLGSFVNDVHGVPGRFNVFEHRGATLIADYGHNPDAIAALSQAVSAMPARQRSVVISGAGDRRDEDIVRQTQILGQSFDEVVLYQDACQRGRQDGEVLALLRKGLENATRTQHVAEVHGEFAAIDHALDRVQSGDVCLILIDQVEEALAHIRKRVAEGQQAKAAQPKAAGKAKAARATGASKPAKRAADKALALKHAVTPVR
jgi:cyanophycin synthetase